MSETIQKWNTLLKCPECKAEFDLGEVILHHPTLPNSENNLIDHGRGYMECPKCGVCEDEEAGIEFPIIKDI